MSKRTQSHASVETVTEILLENLNTQGQSGWQVQHPVTLRHMPWSTLYFIELLNGVQHRKLVVKIAHFPDQTHAAVSWESEELLVRGQREYASQAAVYDHFLSKSTEGLLSVPVVAYLPAVNGIVMEFVVGQPLYNFALTPLRILRPLGLKRAADLLAKTGKWLRWFHDLPLDEMPSDRVLTPDDSLEALLGHVYRLREAGISVEAFQNWQMALGLLQQVKEMKPVWCHGDFHLRNIFVLPDGGILGMDTALERISSPYYDIGKLIADLKTRKSRILTGGLIPGDRAIDSLADAFLRGYFAGDSVNRRELLLYEGRYLLQKWHESVQMLNDVSLRLGRPPASFALRVLINPTFSRIVKGWLRDVLETSMS